MIVRARDQRTTEKTADAFVYVNVVRNRFRPTFVNTPYRFGVSENENALTGRILYTVSAIDSDLAVSYLY